MLLIGKKKTNAFRKHFILSEQKKRIDGHPRSHAPTQFRQKNRNNKKKRKQLNQAGVRLSQNTVLIPNGDKNTLKVKYMKNKTESMKQAVGHKLG